MGKVISVDFQKKQKEFSWDDGRDEKLQYVNEIAVKLQEVINQIKLVADNDVRYQKHCTKTLCDIVLSLKERI